MAFTGKSLADGQISDSQANIYASPSTKVTIVKSLHVYNTNSTAETVKIYVKRFGSTARQIGIAVLAQDESKQFVSDGEAITLSSEDSIQAITTTASKVNYVLTGAQE